MFEITPDDIALLGDEQLRILVGLLCEAELRSFGHSSVSVTWGGNQTAKDGGLDVRVSLPTGTAIAGFIPRASTGFQVKKQDMPRTAITAEMRPKGVLRPVIEELVGSRGAYIIASSEGSTTGPALDRRREAMADAVKHLANASQLALDFYDRGRLASWVRNHPGLIIWVRNAIGRAIPGWEPFGAWAYPAGGPDAEYLLDEGLRVCARPATCNGDLTLAAGIDKLRNDLRESPSVVRLIGLSGVGKTRLVQALFDNRIGANALDPSRAIYANMNNEPNPQPVSLASDLIATAERAILIVDNCAPDLHNRLAEVARKPQSQLSILTVEYDIRDDQPEGTEVYELQAASKNLIEKLLRHRFGLLSQIDARTAAEFSGGNARIAIALAETVGKTGTLAGLGDEDLFRRLFVQRQEHDKSLLRTAQVCSLVYSFNGEDLTDGEDGELVKLGKIIGVSANDVYCDVAELLKRDLAQCRGMWRAVLPHAIANKLALSALQSIPVSQIENVLVNSASERLVKSFARRLGYLHTSAEAANVVKNWFSPMGWMNDIWNLNDFGKAVFQNILPTDPEACLRAIENGLPAPSATPPIRTGQYLARALRSLAYDATLFERCIAVIQVLAIRGDETVAKEAAEIHKSLFTIYLSGTHATVEQRAAAAKKLLISANALERAIGIAALDAMLKAMHFSSYYDFQFGAHSRDYGYQPKTHGDLTHWYRIAFELTEATALSDGPASAAAKNLISANLRGLWSRAGLRDELERVCLAFANHGFWPEGWQAVKFTRHYDEKDTISENYARLSRLEEALRPTDLVQQVRGRVLGRTGTDYDLDDVDVGSADGFRIAMEKKQAEAETLGSEVAFDEAALTQLLPDIVSCSGNIWHFGIGLARGSNDVEALWHRIAKQFDQTAPENRNARIFCGLLWELRTRDPTLAEKLLDEAMEDRSLSFSLPALQSAAGVSVNGMDRLIRSLELELVPLHSYRNVHTGHFTDSGVISKLAQFVKVLAQKDDGAIEAVHILQGQFFADNQAKRGHAAELMASSREVLTKVKFNRKTQHEDYLLGSVIAASLPGDGGGTVAKLICNNLRAGVEAHEAYGWDHFESLKALFDTQPEATLDSFLTGDQSAIAKGAEIIRQSSHHHPNPMDWVDESIVLKWCGRDPGVRFPAVAAAAGVFRVSQDNQPQEWGSVAGLLVHSAPDPRAVMKEIVAQLHPYVWSGSRATILETNAKLLEQFDTRGNISLETFITEQIACLLEEARAGREWETKHDKGRDERFEY